jgi:hypothetical protein
VKVVIRAPLLSISGYGVHSRQIFKWLEAKNVDITAQILQWGNTSWMINPDLEEGIVGKIMEASKEPVGKFDISFQVQLPDEWDPNIAKINIGVSAVVETDRCNPQWLESIDRMDAVVVPTNHIRQTILNTGEVKTPIHVIPEWYFSEIDSENFTELDLNLDTSFNFLMVAQFTGNNSDNDRKNIFNTMKWFCEAFSKDPDVGLIIKSNHGRGTKLDRQVTKTTIRKILGEVRQGPYPKVHVLHGNLTTSEIAGLYKRDDVKCFLSLTRGEGFGLPLLEAAACGLPIMATNWSGHLDFLSLGRFIPIQYRLQEIPLSRVDNRIFLEGMRWADPLENDFKKKILKLKNKYDIPQQWASDLSFKIKTSFCSASIMKIYDKTFQEYLSI